MKGVCAQLTFVRAMFLINIAPFLVAKNRLIGMIACYVTE